MTKRLIICADITTEDEMLKSINEPSNSNIGTLCISSTFNITDKCIFPQSLDELFITFIPFCDTVCLRSLTNLTELTLLNVGFNSLDDIGTLTNLRYLDISNTQRDIGNYINDFKPLLNLTFLKKLNCNIRGNIYVLYNRIGSDSDRLLIYNGIYGWQHITTHTQILWWTEGMYDLLQGEYYTLTKFSKEDQWLRQVRDLSLEFETTITTNIFEKIEKLQDIYDQLWYAPYGPNFIEGSQLCKVM